jgi:uncharacterized protein YkwD
MFVLLITGCTTNEMADATVVLINGSRESSGLPALRWDNEAAAKAQAWAEHLAAQGQLEHSNLSAGFSSKWAHLAENVAFAGDVGTIHRNLLQSATHRANILSAESTAIGVGIVERDGRIWVVEVFRG